MSNLGKSRPFWGTNQIREMEQIKEGMNFYTHTNQGKQGPFTVVGFDSVIDPQWFSAIAPSGEKIEFSPRDLSILPFKENDRHSLWHQKHWASFA